jgi:nucleoside 2-deoxyribosyltransferase
LTIPRVYLAGPDVFLDDAEAFIDRKKAICAALGLDGVSPLDELPDEPAAWAELPDWQRIAYRNEAHIRSCQAVLANLIPFRGPSADVGTVYEIGFARALGLKVFGYAATTRPFLDRTLAATACTEAADGTFTDANGMLVEQFGLFDNLMIEAGITGSGGSLSLVDADDHWHDLAAFSQAARAAATALKA